MQLELDEFCPCCDYATCDKEDRLNYQICPICYWEDDPVQFKNPNFEGGANSVSLIQARGNFEKFGACEKEMVEKVRRPNEADDKKE